MHRTARPQCARVALLALVSTALDFSYEGGDGSLSVTFGSVNLLRDVFVAPGYGVASQRDSDLPPVGTTDSNTASHN
jgi:hypothetical protein